MDISVQYLEGGPYTRRISPQAARSFLHDMLERVPFTRVLLGWDVDLRAVDACAQECARHHCELYLWQPMLTSHGRFIGQPQWRVVGLGGETVAGLDEKLEFTFLCPNNAAVRDSALQCLSNALGSGFYRGVFLDRIRFPSPSAGLSSHFACFCEACRLSAREINLDLPALQQDVSPLLQSLDGRRLALSAMLSAGALEDAGPELDMLQRFLAFREQSVSRFVAEAAMLAHSRGFKVGLDCFSPALARMVGQDLAALAKNADWVKVMTYARAFAPASLPYE